MGSSGISKIPEERDPNLKDKTERSQLSTFYQTVFRDSKKGKKKSLNLLLPDASPHPSEVLKNKIRNVNHQIWALGMIWDLRKWKQEGTLDLSCLGWIKEVKQREKGWMDKIKLERVRK